MTRRSGWAGALGGLMLMTLSIACECSDPNDLRVPGSGCVVTSDCVPSEGTLMCCANGPDRGTCQRTCRVAGGEDAGREPGDAWVAPGDAWSAPVDAWSEPTTSVLPGDAVMLSDLRRVTRSGGAFVESAPSVSANVIHASAETESRFVRTPGGLVFAGMDAWTSTMGLMEFSLRSSTQDMTARWTGSAYLIGPLTPDRGYADVDMLTVEDASSGIRIEVPAPPPIRAADLFAEPRGFLTRLEVPDGSFDTVFVYVLGRTPGEGIMRLVPSEAMELVGANRVMQMVDNETITAFNGLPGGIGSVVYVGVYRQQISTELFPGGRPVPVQAGRMFQLALDDLALGS